MALDFEEAADAVKNAKRRPREEYEEDVAASRIEASERLRIVKDALSSYPGPKRRMNTYTLIRCPYHADNNPSARVSHDPSRPGGIGYFSCWGCPARRKWSEFAVEQGLPTFVMPETMKVRSLSSMFAELNQSLMGIQEGEDADDVDQETLQRRGEGSALVKEDYELLPLDATAMNKLGLRRMVWRGFTFEFLTEMGAKCIAVTKLSTRAGAPKGATYVSYYVFLPAYIHGRLRGYVKALPRKGSPTSYINAPGKWSHSHGLLFFDTAMRIMNRKGNEPGARVLVLVEGPRDVLRLLAADIPAMAILGTKSWSDDKVNLIAMLSIDAVILCMDGDTAGRKAAKLLRSGISPDTQEAVASPLYSAVPTFVFNLVKHGDNEEEGVDVFKAKDSTIEILREWTERC